MTSFTRTVLDHGFVTLRNLAGPTRRMHSGPPNLQGNDFLEAMLEPRSFDADDIDPANAARMSFDNFDLTRPREADLKLCDYLMANWHSTPFEMLVCWVEMKLPIFIARQFVRHRTVTINEVSGRYVTLPAEWYIPEIQNVVMQQANKKQGGRPINMDDPVDVARGERYRKRLENDCIASYAAYQESVEDGIAMEQARLSLHLNHYTHWLWKQDMHNMMHFLRLRDHSHAQAEARMYAQAIDSLLREQLPNTMGLYDKYRRQE